MYRISQAAQRLGVTPKTLRVWERQGKIHSVRTPGNQRRYTPAEIDRLLGLPQPTHPRCVIYARVSSHQQTKDGNLERQVERLKVYATQKGYAVIKVLNETGSGLNEKRRQLSKLFQMVHAGEVDVVVIEFKDRLARFGYTYIERFLQAFGVTLEVVEATEPKSAHQELVEDLLSILTCFSARLYGQRSKEFKRKVKQVMSQCSTPSAAKS